MKLINTEEINHCRYCNTPNGNSTDDESGELFCLFLHYLVALVIVILYGIILKYL